MNFAAPSAITATGLTTILNFNPDLTPSSVAGPDGKLRCPWGLNPPEYIAYHDEEWGRPLHGDTAIFERLCREGERTVGALTIQSGVLQPAVSKHLAHLKAAGLVRDRHAGRQTHYSADAAALAPLIDWTSQMTGFWEQKFNELEDLLKRMDQ